MSLPSFTLRELMQAGVHFGHHPRRWNPKMQPFLFGVRNDVHIINLERTAPLLTRALQATHEVIKSGGRMLFVGTKKQASSIIAEYAQRSGQYYVNHRWLGGMLTNWKTVSQSIKRMNQHQDRLNNATALRLTKKETLKLQREIDNLERSLGGIKEMGGVPDVIFVLDTQKERIAIDEANHLGIPVIAILDSNSDPQGIDYPIPGNDDAIRSIELYCRLLSETILGGIKEQMSAAGLDMGSSAEVLEEIADEEPAVEAAAPTAEA